MGTSINHVDSCGERFLTKWPLYWLCYIHLSLFSKSFYEGVKNTQKLDHVVYGCPTCSLFSHQGHKCIPFEVKEVLCFFQLIWWILINKNDNKTLTCKGADWCTHAIFEMSQLIRNYSKIRGISESFLSQICRFLFAAEINWDLMKSATICRYLFVLQCGPH